MKKGNIIGAFIFVIVLAVTILVYMVSVSSDESSENMPANVPAVVKPETKAQDKAVVDVYWDATSSMAGYATISNGNLYKNLPDNLEDVASSLGDVHFFRFGKEITPLQGREHRNFSNPGYHTELVTSVHNVVSNADPEHVSVIVTDLYEDAADLGNISKKIREKYFSNHEAVAIIGIRNPFDGTIYDIGLSANKINYNSGNDASKYRPFYLLILGPENNVAAFLQKWKNRNVDGFDIQYVMLTENIIGKSTNLANMKLLAEDTQNLLRNEVLPIQDDRIKQYVLDSMDDEAVLAAEFTYKPGLGSCTFDIDNLKYETKVMYSENGEWLPVDTGKNVSIELQEKEDDKYQVTVKFLPRDVLEKGKINFLHIELIPGDDGLKLPDWISSWTLPNINLDAASFDGTKTVNFNRFVENLKDEVMGSQPVIVNMDMVINAKEGW